MIYFSHDFETLRDQPRTPDGIIMASTVVEDCNARVPRATYMTDLPKSSDETTELPPVTSLPHLTAIIMPDDPKALLNGSRVALAMNSWILVAIEWKLRSPKYSDKQSAKFFEDLGVPTATINLAQNAIANYKFLTLAEWSEQLIEFFKQYKPNGTDKVTIAGKNVGSFDLPFFPKNVQDVIQYSVIDFGPLWIDWRKDLKVPHSGECYRRAKVNSGESHYHDAYIDAMACIQCCRPFYDPRLPVRAF
jgi:hypothetical protein